jgi:N-acetylmuramoyl-L-alanine amidase
MTVNRDDDCAGTGPYRVAEDECLESIAAAHGLTVEYIWNHPANAELRRVRRDPNILLAGDRLTLPERRQRDETLATGRLHTVKLRRGLRPVRFTLVREDIETLPTDGSSTEEDWEHSPPAFEPVDVVPWKSVHARFESGSETWEADANDKGVVTFNLPVRIKGGVLVIAPGMPEETSLRVQIGRLDPIETLSGAVQRLQNMGYQVAAPEDLPSVIREFQADEGIEMNGTLDGPTRQKLATVHGS